MKAGHLEKGMYILYKNNEPFLVQEREFVKPGKGGAFVRCKLKGLLSGQTVKENIKSNDTLEIANVEHGQGQYLYTDGTHLHFMDTENFEQYTIEKNKFEKLSHYLLEGEAYQLTFFDEQVIDIILPPKVILTVTSASEALKGDTATSVTKIVECETGLEIRVPGFIKEEEKIVVNTETHEYVERAN